MAVGDADRRDPLAGERRGQGVAMGFERRARIDNSDLALTINNIEDKGPPKDKSYSGTTAYPYYNIFNFNGYGRAFWLEYRIDLGAGK